MSRRKDIVNYVINQWVFMDLKPHYLSGALIIRRSHPLFMQKDALVKLLREVHPYYVNIKISTGAKFIKYLNIKKKFKNSNFCVMSVHVWEDYRSKEDFKNDILSTRMALILSYIRNKRK